MYLSLKRKTQQFLCLCLYDYDLRSSTCSERTLDTEIPQQYSALFTFTEAIPERISLCPE